jgi:MORN repeat variant
MKYLVSMLLFFGLSSCSDKEVIIQKYDNGQKKVTYVILKGSKDKPIDFKYRAYFDNGIVMKEGLMRNVKEEGEWKYYFDNGKIGSIGNFQNGVRSGKFLRYYESGEIEQDGIYINGEISQSTFFHRNGTIKNKEAFDPTPFIIDSPTAWTESQKQKISSRCNHVLQFEYKNSNMFCKCMVDSVSTHVEFTSIDTLSDYDKSLIYRVFMKAGACDGLFY